MGGGTRSEPLGWGHPPFQRLSGQALCEAGESQIGGGGPLGEGATRALTNGTVWRARDPSSKELEVNPRDGGESHK